MGGINAEDVAHLLKYASEETLDEIAKVLAPRIFNLPINWINPCEVSKSGMGSSLAKEIDSLNDQLSDLSIEIDRK